MDRETLFQIIKEEILNHSEMDEETVEEISDSISERLLEEGIFDEPVSNKRFLDD